MSPRYFKGNSVHGPVSAGVEQTFRDVVDAFRICPTIGLTRAAFLSLDKKQRNEKKQVPFFVPATFKATPSKRVYEQALCCNLIFLDIDETREGKCPAAPFFHNPQLLYDALNGFNFVAHTTASSTMEKPRMRIVVDAEKIPIAAYPQAVSSVGAMLGLPALTHESKVAVQPMFLPTQFSDSSDEEHPVIAHRLEGRPFTVKDIREDDLSGFSSSGNGHSANGSNGHTPRAIIDDSDALFYLRAPVPEITLAIAKKALECIDPDCSYFEWIECAQALKHQFSPHKTEEAYTLFDEWSHGGNKYASSDETKAKWDSFQPTPKGRLPVTIRSLLRQAVASGWDDKKVKEDCFGKVVQWFEECSTVTELMEQGVHKILATPLLSAVQEDVLISQLCSQAKKRFAYSITATAIRKDLARAKTEEKDRSKAAEKRREPSWAKGVLYVAAAQDFYRHRTGERYKVSAFDASYSRWLLPTEDSLKDAGKPVTPENLAKPIVPPSDYALNHLKIPAVYDYAYDPSQPASMFFVHAGKKYLNTYSPTYPEPDPEHAQAAGELFQRHLSNLIAEPDYRAILTDFCAYMVQCPGRKIRWAVMIQSCEGGGKTFLAEAMKAVLGAEHVKTISGAAIKSGFNEWSFGHQLVVLEEVRVAGTNRHEIMNALKPLITNDDISINQKFRDAREVTNISNYMLFSNHHDAIHLTPGDRRYFVVKSPMQAKEQVLALGEDYFPPLFAMLRERAGALRSFLSDWEIGSNFQPDGHAPRTKYVQNLINDSASGLTAAVRRLIAEADYPLIQFDIVSAKTMMDVLTMEDGLHLNAQQLAACLREEGYRQIGRHKFGDDRHYLWIKNGVREDGVVETAMNRFKKDLKNLEMEMIYG